MITSKGEGGQRHPLSPDQANLKVQAYFEWKRDLPVEQRKMLVEWESTLTKRIKDMGEKSACELLSEILLQERRIRSLYE